MTTHRSQFVTQPVINMRDSKFNSFFWCDRLKTVSFAKRLEFAVRVAHHWVGELLPAEFVPRTKELLAIVDKVYRKELIAGRADFDKLSNFVRDLYSDDARKNAKAVLSRVMQTAYCYKDIREASECAMPAALVAEEVFTALSNLTGGHEIGEDFHTTLEKLFANIEESSYETPAFEDYLTIRWVKSKPTVALLVSGANPILLRCLVNRPEYLHLLTPTVFEEVIALLLCYDGYETSLTKQSHDGGIDVRAELPERELLLVQCKKHREDNKVPVDTIRSLRGVVRTENATRGILATTSTFTRSALKEIERSKFSIEGRDFDFIKDWLVRNYDKMWDQCWIAETDGCVTMR